MAEILRKIFPVGLGQSVPKDDNSDDEIKIDYSFAIEYQGPPVPYQIPQAFPVDVDRLPTAATVSSASALNDVSLPVIQPIVKAGPDDRKLAKGQNSFCGAISCQESCDDHGVSVESSIQGDDDECAEKLCQGRENSGKLDNSDDQDNLQESSRRLEALELPTDSREGLELIEDGDPALANSDSTESGLSTPALSSSEVSSCRGEEGKDETPSHVRKPSVVTFCEPELTDIVQEEYEYSEAESSQAQELPRNGKKGSCYRCLKGNRFTIKEICMVCNAKYCRYCVLRAMGSMPEGRKCVSCIGRRINESNRETLGKCSRMLKQLLPASEVKHIMWCESSCKENQLPPDLVYVNDEPLSQQELLLLQTCLNPPKKLKPGHYWYDKVSGFWGKQGQGPCQIISHQLNVGGHIKSDASNGNTKIFINNREITKKELWMLQCAGVQCEGMPHFWVSADGSYQEEGQRNVVGRIWGKTGIKLVCAFLSLPVPHDHHVNASVEEISRSNQGLKVPYKLLLLGYEKSGTSTIYKQTKILYHVPFTENEHQNIKLMIQSNLYRYLGILLEGREQFEEQSLLEVEGRKIQMTDEAGPSGIKSPIDGNTVYSIAPRLKSFSDWFLQVMVSGNLETIFPAATREYAPFVEELWKDAAFQATYSRRHELEMLPRIATYFLERAVEISRADYEPSDMDILYAEGITSSNGLSFVEFSFPKLDRENSLDSDYQHDPSQRYQLIRLHPSSLGENCKFVEMFEDVDMVLFCVSLTDYDEFFEDSHGVRTNKMLASKQLFESIVTHPTFDSKNFVLMLNKFDLLEEKIEQVSLTKCEWFHDFHPVIGHNNKGGTSLAQHAFHYIALQFKRLFKSLSDRKLYVSQVTGLEPDSVDEALRYSRDILKWDEDERYFSFTNPELSSTDIEASSSS
ncbi:hypothetical protein SLEP1_g33435 [Rubroshorea leprosula]|uniref:Extra-large guanine nucleotide-binding protein 1-like n=1 Tax=Rubroshorea leprosula TaxID=152421 RepID=A0AAV5KGJ4_9ROSI|nr:hypothetical protein SLEP1_g33435 [Rubroshorea leprosula]